jgi:hypothetical protein
MLPNVIGNGSSHSMATGTPVVDKKRPHLRAAGGQLLLACLSLCMLAGQFNSRALPYIPHPQPVLLALSLQ